jgi:hypothetical protein
MDFDQLQTQLNQLGVTPPDILRASLYLDSLINTRNFLHNQMSNPVPGGLGNNYAFVQQAVRSNSLLNELAEILDWFVSPAIEADLQHAHQIRHNAQALGWTYRDYFDNTILDANAQIYQNNIQGFFGRYPITSEAMQRLTQNFQQNILQACQRIIQDRGDIERLFSDLYIDLSLDYLSKIKSTGSDFHKGGKQVLILTFSKTSYVVNLGDGDLDPVPGELKLVYKPSDLEADCMLAGNSAAVNRVDPAFDIANSLVEIFNNLVENEQQNDSNTPAVKLPTYRILPKNPTSRHQGGYPLPIRDAYGYIEYLSYDLSWTAIEFFSYFPFATSDWLIFRSQDERPIIEKFYRQLGQWIALACSFSILDLHLQNIRCHQYEAYPIDMEISLTKSVAGVGDTILLAPYVGGINGLNVGNSEFVWVVKNSDIKGQAFLDKDYQDDYYQNRLYKQTYRGRVLVQINKFYLLQGFQIAMNLLRSGQQNNYFVAWFDRLNNVLVRYLPYATSEFQAIRNQIYIDAVLETNGNPVPLIPKIIEMLRQKITTNFNNYNLPSNPNFLALQPNVSSADYENSDIPVFYHRIGSQDIVNSQGQIVNIPAQIDIYDMQNYPNVIQGNVNIGRAEFFQNLPTQANVKQGQIDILIGDTFDERLRFISRFQQLKNSICEALNIQIFPDDFIVF